jgi:hypothetical protein
VDIHVVASKSYAAGGAGSWSNRKTAMRSTSETSASPARTTASTSGPSRAARFEKEWPAELKDDLEHRLCQTVCAGSREAQREISADWTESYLRRFRRAAK